MDHQNYSFQNQSCLFLFRGILNFWVFIALFMLLDLHFGSIAYAQVERVQKGDRLRISAPSVQKGKIMGTVTSYSSTSLSLTRKDTTLVIPYPLIQKVDISIGKKRNVGKGFVIGFVGGGLFLGSHAAFTNSSCYDDGWEWCPDPGFTYGFKAGALLGGVLGAFIGILNVSDRWEEVPVNISAGATPVSYKSQKFNSTVTIRISF